MRGTCSFTCVLLVCLTGFTAATHPLERIDIYVKGEGIITSKGLKHHPDKVSFKLWNLKTDEGDKVALNFTHIYLACYKEFVVVCDCGECQIPYCDPSAPRWFTSTKSSLTLIFYSSVSPKRGIFKARYNKVPGKTKSPRDSHKKHDRRTGRRSSRTSKSSRRSRSRSRNRSSRSRSRSRSKSRGSRRSRKRSRTGSRSRSRSSRSRSRTRGSRSRSDGDHFYEDPYRAVRLKRSPSIAGKSPRHR